MAYENLIKNKIQHAFGSFLEKLSIERKLTKDQMKCMQFGITDFAPRQIEEIPFLITNLNLF